MGKIINLVKQLSQTVSRKTKTKIVHIFLSQASKKDKIQQATESKQVHKFIAM